MHAGHPGVGLRPYKDSWFSTHQDWAAANVTCLESRGAPPYFGLQEQYPELQLLVSALSAGPIAPGDNIGFSNVSLIMRACRADGVLLHPDRPAAPPDPMFLSERGKGEVQCSYTRLDGEVWTFCLSFAMRAEVTLTGSDLGLSSPGHGVAWARKDLDPFVVNAQTHFQRYSGEPSTLSLPMHSPQKEWGHYTYWRTAPTSCNGTGWTLLGELQKVISVSAQRVQAVQTACDGPTMVVAVTGMVGEGLELTFLSPSGQLQVPRLVVGPDGSATVKCGQTSCTQTE